jgi:hypothetical protein
MRRRFRRLINPRLSLAVTDVCMMTWPRFGGQEQLGLSGVSLEPHTSARVHAIDGGAIFARWGTAVARSREQFFKPSVAHSRDVRRKGLEQLSIDAATNLQHSQASSLPG